MSQYPYSPNPYTPPALNYGAPSGWPRPDRSAFVAGIMQLVLGGMMFLAGTCAGAGLYAAGIDSIMEEWQKKGVNIPSIPGYDTVAVIRVILICFFAGMILAGVLLVALSPFVFRRKRGATLFSAVIVGVIALLVMLSIVSGLSQLGVDPTMIFYVGALAYCIGTIVKLIQALRNAPDPRAIAAMQQAWYWMQQQQMGGGYGWDQGHGTGTGYGYPPPPASGAAPSGEGENPPAPPA